MANEPREDARHHSATRKCGPQPCEAPLHARQTVGTRCRRRGGGGREAGAPGATGGSVPACQPHGPGVTGCPSPFPRDHMLHLHRKLSQESGERLVTFNQKQAGAVFSVINLSCSRVFQGGGSGPPWTGPRRRALGMGCPRRGQGKGVSRAAHPGVGGGHSSANPGCGRNSGNAGE